MNKDNFIIRLSIETSLSCDDAKKLVDNIRVFGNFKKATSIYEHDGIRGLLIYNKIVSGYVLIGMDPAHMPDVAVILNKPWEDYKRKGY